MASESQPSEDELASAPGDARLLSKSFQGLLVTQFLGATNDNILRWLVTHHIWRATRVCCVRGVRRRDLRQNVGRHVHQSGGCRVVAREHQRDGAQEPGWAEVIHAPQYS